jgi:hypothetical protein
MDRVLVHDDEKSTDPEPPVFHIRANQVMIAAKRSTEGSFKRAEHDG